MLNPRWALSLMVTLMVPTMVFAETKTEELIVNVGGEITVLEKDCEIEERMEYSDFDASLLDPKPAPSCDPLVVPTAAPKFSNQYLSTTYSVFFGEIIGGITDIIDTSSFNGTMAPIPGHPNQTDIGNFSFVLDNITAESVDLKDYGMDGKKLKVVDGSLMVATTEYRQAFTIRRRGGEEFKGAAEARIALRSAFKVQTTEILLGFMNNRVAPCLAIADENISASDEETKSWGQIQKNLCVGLDSSKLSGSNSQKAHEMLKNWKKALIDQIKSLHATDPTSFVSPKCEEVTAIAENPAFGETAARYKAVKDKYCNDSYQEILDIMDQGIEIAYQGNEAKLNLHIENINKQIGDRFPDFFDTFKLDVVIIKNFAATFGDNETSLVVDLSIKQPKERVNHGIAGVGGLVPLFNMYQEVRSQGQATAVGNLMAKAAIGIFKRKLPSVFTNVSYGGAGVSAAGSAIKNEGIGLLLDAQDTAAGIGNFLFGSDEEEE